MREDGCSSGNYCTHLLEISSRDDFIAQPKSPFTPDAIARSHWPFTKSSIVQSSFSREWTSEADCVLIVGYSLPDNDPQARCKILTAFQVNQGCLWAVVDPSQEVRAKYERLLGSRRLITFDQGLAGFAVNLEENLRTAFPKVEIKPKLAPPRCGCSDGCHADDFHESMKKLEIMTGTLAT